jgi:antitoxin (DNA-binding transcriptional repressor) of toxin-antitoxin stability system
MISVGVRDLKNQLSQYLQQVKLGEKVLITEHNKVIAEIRLPADDIGTSKIEDQLQLLSDSGKLLRAKRNKSIKLEAELISGIDWISEYQENRSE